MKEAIKKLQAEMDANKNDFYIQDVGKALIQYVETHPEDAAKFADADKTIAKSYAEMEKQAKAKAKNNRAMFTPQQGYEIIMKYFGVTAGTVPVPEIQKPAAPETKSAIAKTDFDISLDDLLA
ncbi:MAG: hypothetical protein WC420_03980 [Candidatus Paceibacterota bacterium]